MPSPGLSSVLAGEGWARTSDNAVNSRALYQLSYDTTNGEGGGYAGITALRLMAGNIGFLPPFGTTRS